MRALTIVELVVLATQIGSAQDPERDFSGTWRLNTARSDIRSRFDIPSGFLRITQTASTMTVSASAQEGEPAATIVYPVAGKSERSQMGGITFNIATKWEGSALLANIIAGGQADYVLSERWVRSRNGSRLTITRTLEGRGSEIESTLAYDSPNAAPPQISENRERPAPQETRQEARLAPRPQDAAPAEYGLEPGTRILLRLTNAVNTKHSAPGDRIYLQTAMPVFMKGSLIIPQGSYVIGTITESQRAGRIKGRSDLNFRFETLTLPNGVTRDFRSRAGSVDAQGNLDRTEGRIKGEGTKGKDAGTVAGTTAGGAGIGTIAGAAAGHVGTGLGIGAAAGAVAGLAGVLGSRGQDVVIPVGSTMEMVLDRELRFTGAELFGRIQ
jgi:hypothetical protein